MHEIEQLINSDDSDKDLFICNNTKSRFEMEHIFDYNEEATLKVKAMLRQAADTEEENLKLKAQLKKIANMLANVNHECKYSNTVSMLKDEYDAILRAADIGKED